MIMPAVNCRIAVAFTASKIPPKIPGAAVTSEVGEIVLAVVGAAVTQDFSDDLIVLNPEVRRYYAHKKYTTPYYILKATDLPSILEKRMIRLSN